MCEIPWCTSQTEVLQAPDWRELGMCLACRILFGPVEEVLAIAHDTATEGQEEEFEEPALAVA